MKKFGKFLKKAQGVLGEKGKDIGQLALNAATGDFKGVVKEVGDILGMDTSEEGKALSEEFLLKKEEFEMEAMRIEAADRDSARDMQEEALKGSDLFAKRFIYYLAIFWSVVAALFVCFIFFVNIPEENIRLVDTVEGFVMGSIVSSIIGFFYGGLNKKED